MSIGPIARKIWHMSVRCRSWKVIWLCTPLRNGLTLGAKAGETFDRGILEESDHGWRTKNPALLVSTERLANSETVPCQDARFPPSPTTLIVKALAQVFRGGVHAGWTGRRRMNSGVQIAVFTALMMQQFEGKQREKFGNTMEHYKIHDAK